MSEQPKFDALITYIESHQCNWSMKPDPSGEQWGIHLQDDPPHNKLLGPVFERGNTSGIVVHKGERVCEWGDTHRADMTFSVTKTYLALTTGIAFDQGLIDSLDQPIVEKVQGIGFEGQHNQQITWRHLLQFTSEWNGLCFGVPDQIDHYRQLASQPSKLLKRKGEARSLQTPGTYWEYNDVRINQFSLALMHLFEQPIPDVLKNAIMQPLGVSDSWAWHGYDNSWVESPKGRMQSVPGGGHWGGGMVISPEDQITIAQMMINKGEYGPVGNRKRLLSSEWIELMTSPCDIAPYYGFFTWLNFHNNISQSAPASSYFAMGIGGQYLLHDPDNELVACYRWLDSEFFSEIVGKTYKAIGI